MFMHFEKRAFVEQELHFLQIIRFFMEICDPVYEN